MSIYTERISPILHVLEEEQINSTFSSEVIKGIWQGNDYARVAEYLFGVIPHENDERWKLVQFYLEVNDRAKFKPYNFENAQIATYLSDKQGYRGRFGSTTTEHRIRCLCRALQNLNEYNTLKARFEKLDLPDTPDVNLMFSRTDSIQSGKNKQGITGCPEAIYQLRMFCNDQYVARTGFNVHYESGSQIWSITNLQGIPGASEIYKNISVCGRTPFNALVETVKDMAKDDESIEIRGLKNPKHTESAPLYNSVFKHSGIKRMSKKMD